MRISDWSSDVCSSDLYRGGGIRHCTGLLNKAIMVARLIREDRANAFNRCGKTLPRGRVRGSAPACRLVLAIAALFPHVYFPPPRTPRAIISRLDPTLPPHSPRRKSEEQREGKDAVQSGKIE